MFRIGSKSKRQKNWKYYNPRFLMANIMKMTFFLPASLIFFTQMMGPDVKAAMRNSLQLISSPDSGPFVWVLLILLNLSIFLYLKPVLLFHTINKRNEKCSPMFQMKVVRRFNRLPFFIIAITLCGFFLIAILDSLIIADEESIIQFSILYGMMQSLSVGLFIGTLLYLNIENMLFPVKKEVFSENDGNIQKYSSFYRKIILIMFAIVFFLIFEIFDSFSGFYMAGESELLGDVGRKVMDSGAFFRFTREHEELRTITEVLLFKLVIYVFYIIHLLRQIQKMLQNPLQTVRQKLEVLNSDEPEQSKEIDIINNDEFTGIYREINKLIEKQNTMLQRSEEQLEKIVDNAADPIVSFHDNGIIHVFNPAAESFFGYKKDEILTKSLITLIDLPDEIRSKCEKDISILIGYISNRDTMLKRFTGIHKSGDKINFESNISRSDTDHGSLYTAVLRDITGQLEFEENLTNAKISAENANKMKSEFLANMSHELRTPLNAVLGFTQLLSTDKNLTGGQLEKINIISRSGEHLLALINDILDISKIESGKTEIHENVFDLHRFIEDIKSMFTLRCRTKGLSFYVEYAGEIPPYVKGDLGKLRQIMINIIGNAVKFTGEGGVSLLVGEENGNIRFSINDTGKGIPKSEIGKILQPFMQSSNVDHEGGTGLGLAITNSFIKMMGGELEVTSQLGTGSTFAFELPLEISATGPQREETRGKVLSIKGGEAVRALIVDDKVNNRLILKAMLENVGFITMEAENGQEAIERTEDFDPAIIFMDIKMPVMDGYRAVEALKKTEKGKNITIFALTASAFRHDEKKIFDSGFDGFLPKPFKLESLFRIISDNTGVDFIYDDYSAEAKVELLNPEDLDFAFLAGVLSDDDLEKLADDILINDFAAIKEISVEWGRREKLGDFTALLKYYADNFNDQRLEEILEKIKDKKNG